MSHDSGFPTSSQTLSVRDRADRNDDIQFRSGMTSVGFFSIRPNARIETFRIKFLPDERLDERMFESERGTSARVATTSTAPSCFSSTQSSVASRPGAVL